jgi:hypothetical protein
LNCDKFLKEKVYIGFLISGLLSAAVLFTCFSRAINQSAQYSTMHGTKFMCTLDEEDNNSEREEKERGKFVW